MRGPEGRSPDTGAEEPLRVVHVSTDDVTGGAARCAHRLHRGLLERGHDSRMLVQRKRSDDPTVERFRPDPGLRRRIARRWRRWRIERDHARYEASAPAWPEPFHGDRTPFGREVPEALPPADVIHLHWISRFVDFGSFFRAAPEGVPVVWTLHDMNAFTGGCHYDRGCGRYRDRCGACPQLGSDRERDLSREVWRRKDDVYAGLENGGLQVVTPSRWLAEVASRSTLFDGRFPISVVPYGVDTEVFAPRDPGLSRDVLGLPRDARVVLFVAHDVENDRKGFAVLREALEGLRDVPGLVLASLGKGDPDLPVGVDRRHLGYVTEDRYLSLVYSAADAFVVPSRQDNLPATVLEAMACGTPVAGSDVGGIPEMVRPGETGALAEDGDPGSLERAIRDLVGDPGPRAEMAERCRRVALDEYALDRQAADHERLYRRLLAGSARGGRASGRTGAPDPSSGHGAPPESAAVRAGGDVGGAP